MTQFDGLPCERNDCRLQQFWPASLTQNRLGEPQFGGPYKGDVRCLTCRRHWTIESQPAPSYTWTWSEWFAVPVDEADERAAYERLKAKFEGGAS